MFVSVTINMEDSSEGALSLWQPQRNDKAATGGMDYESLDVTFGSVLQPKQL